MRILNLFKNKNDMNNNKIKENISKNEIISIVDKERKNTGFS